MATGIVEKCRQTPMADFVTEGKLVCGEEGLGPPAAVGLGLVLDQPLKHRRFCGGRAEQTMRRRRRIPNLKRKMMKKEALFGLRRVSVENCGKGNGRTRKKDGQSFDPSVLFAGLQRIILGTG